MESALGKHKWMSSRFNNKRCATLRLCFNHAQTHTHTGVNSDVYIGGKNRLYTLDAQAAAVTTRRMQLIEPSCTTCSATMYSVHSIDSVELETYARNYDGGQANRPGEHFHSTDHGTSDDKSRYNQHHTQPHVFTHATTRNHTQPQPHVVPHTALQPSVIVQAKDSL